MLSARIFLTTSGWKLWLKLALKMKKCILSHNWKSRGRAGSWKREISRSVMSPRSQVLSTLCLAFLGVGFILRLAPFVVTRWLPEAAELPVSFFCVCREGKEREFFLRYQFFTGDFQYCYTLKSLGVLLELFIAIISFFILFVYLLFLNCWYRGLIFININLLAWGGTSWK